MKQFWANLIMESEWPLWGENGRSDVARARPLGQTARRHGKAAGERICGGAPSCHAFIHGGFQPLILRRILCNFYPNIAVFLKGICGKLNALERICSLPAELCIKSWCR